MGVLQGVEDLARVFLHSAGAGVPEWAQRHFGNPASADATDQLVDQSRQRTGFAGALADVGGYVAPGVGLFKGAKAIPGALRAVPRFAPAAERAITNLLPQSGRVIARARLGLPELPTMAETLQGNISNLVRAHPIRTALGAAGLGAAAFAEHASRSDPSIVPSAAAATTPAATVATNAASGGGYDPIPANLRAAAAAPTGPTFSDMVAELMQANGGKISMRQLGALSDVAYKTSPHQSIRTPTNADLAAGEAASVAAQLRDHEIAQAGKDPDKYQSAVDKYYNRMAQLAKGRAPDVSELPSFDPGN